MNMTDISGHTKKLGIFGYPIEHTFSPKMHNFISAQLNNNYVYTAFEVAPENLENAVNAVRALNISGINITAPHKKTVMKFLDEISQQAQKFGSVNTVVNRNGRLYGYNTDAQGFYKALLHNGIEVRNKDILILGEAVRPDRLQCTLRKRVLKVLQ